MAIQVLSQETIDKIAAGEVVERPSSVVKELVENAIDAKASAVTVEIRDGGTSLIRVTDNGCGISREEIALAFLRHSTSKITSAEDLTTVATLGFRGEALSSISAVAQVELLTKTRNHFTGVRYCIEGGIEKSLEEAGTPDGTTFLVRNLFYNTPARKKFLKTNTTEGNYIQDLMERLALSHPEVSFKLISNNQMKLHTSGNGNLKDIIYQIYGMDIAKNLIPVEVREEGASMTGFIGKPLISRGNRQYENYFINGRYVKNSIVTKAIEQGYKNYMMQHKYPFTVLNVQFQGENLDVNVHPTKMELRFSDGEQVYRLFYHAVSEALKRNELIPEVQLSEEKKLSKQPARAERRLPESFEKNRMAKEQKKEETEAGKVEASIAKQEAVENFDRHSQPIDVVKHNTEAAGQNHSERPLMPSREPSEASKMLDSIQSLAGRIKSQERMDANRLNASLNAALGEKENSEKKYEEQVKETAVYAKSLEKPQQLNLFEEQVIERRMEDEIRIIGQVFDTYWILQFEDKMFLVDQHAAHEKILYERTMERFQNSQFQSQLLSPPMVITLSAREAQLLEQYGDEFRKLGFEVESFGGKEYAINAVPSDLLQLQARELFLELLDGLADELGRTKPDMIIEKIASMSCKAAIKGNQQISRQEAEALLKELMKLEDPYHCPHGRPVLISMSKYEIEKKFKRIV